MRLIIYSFLLALLLPFACRADNVWQEMDELCAMPRPVVSGWTPISGLVAHWLMNDNAANTTVLDSYGGHNGTAGQNTSTLTIPGLINGAITNSASIAATYMANGNWSGIVSTGSFTFLCWVKFHSSTALKTAGGNGLFGSSSKWLIYTAGRDAGATLDFVFYLGDAGNNNAYAGATSEGIIPWPSDGWHQFGLMRNGTGQNVPYTVYKFIFDSKIYTASHYDVTGNKSVVDANENKIFSYSAGYENRMAMDDVRLYSRDLSALEITNLYNSATGTESE